MQPVGDGSDQRKFARIESSVTCSVATSADAFEAEIVNLSKGGAAVVGPIGAAKEGDTVTLLLEESTSPVSVAFPAQVMRVERRGAEELFGVQFEPLPPDEEAMLAELIAHVSRGKGQGRREHPRVSARIDVNCQSEDIFRACLNDLSRGGLSLMSGRDVDKGETLTVKFHMPQAKDLLEVAGEVVSSQKIEGGYRLGVRFGPHTPEARAAVDRTLDEMLGVITAEVDET
jgi:c-di-GMP-binding flagellar brake protein YcgR